MVSVVFGPRQSVEALIDMGIDSVNVLPPSNEGARTTSKALGIKASPCCQATSIFPVLSTPTCGNSDLALATLVGGVAKVWPNGAFVSVE